MISAGTVGTPTSTADLMASTLDTYSPTLVDNVSTQVRLLNAIKKSDGMIGVDGGEKYNMALEYALGTMESFGRTTALSMDTPNFMTSYDVTLKNVAVPCRIYDVDEWANDGSKNKRVDFVESLIKNTEKSIKAGFEGMMWAAGAGALDLLGMPDIIGTATIEGVDVTTYPWFVAQTETAVGDFDTNGMDALTRGITKVREANGEDNGEEPDVIGGDANFWNAFIAKGGQVQFLTNTNKLDLGFKGGPTKDGIPVTLFSGAPAGELYGPQFKYLKLIYHKKVNFSPSPWQPIGGGMQGRVRWVIFRGATATTNRRSQVKWTGVTY